MNTFKKLIFQKCSDNNQKSWFHQFSSISSATIELNIFASEQSNIKMNRMFSVSAENTAPSNHVF